MDRSTPRVAERRDLLERVLRAALDVRARLEQLGRVLIEVPQLEVVVVRRCPLRIVPLEHAVEGLARRDLHAVEGVRGAAGGEVVVEIARAGVRRPLERPSVVDLRLIAGRRVVGHAGLDRRPDRLSNHAVLEERLVEQADVIDDHLRAGVAEAGDGVDEGQLVAEPFGEEEGRTGREVVDDLEHGRPLVAAACGAPEPPGDARACGHVAGDDRLRDVVDAVGDHAHRDAAAIEARGTRLRPERRGVPLAGHRPSAPSARPYGHDRAHQREPRQRAEVLGAQPASREPMLGAHALHLETRPGEQREVRRRHRRERDEDVHFRAAKGGERNGY